MATTKRTARKTARTVRQTGRKVARTARQDRTQGGKRHSQDRTEGGAHCQQDRTQGGERHSQDRTQGGAHYSQDGAKDCCLIPALASAKNPGPPAGVFLCRRELRGAEVELEWAKHKAWPPALSSTRLGLRPYSDDDLFAVKLDLDVHVEAYPTKGGRRPKPTPLRLLGPARAGGTKPSGATSLRR